MSGRAGAVAFWGGLLAVVALVALVSRTGDTTGPLDPRSVSPDGARALADLVERFGADLDVVIDVPDAGHDVAVLLRDPYGVADRRRLEDWVRAGGRLLVADPSSPLTPRTSPAASSGTGEPCRTAALAGVTVISGTTTAFADADADADGAGDDDGERCLGGAIAVTPLGDGVIVALAGPEPLLNDRLDEADNAVLAVAVLAPTEGTRVAFVDPEVVVGADQESLADLVGDPVWLVLAQLVAAFVVFAWSRTVRLGRPVVEPLPVRLAGSELTAARGRLLAGLRDPAGVATELRDESRRTLGRALTLPPGTADDVLADRAAAVTGIPAARIEALLGGGVVRGDDDLVAVAAGLAEVEHALRPRPSDPTPARSSGPTDARTTP